MSSVVEQIKDKIDIVSLVSTYIKLEKSGKNFKGKCPFHNEKTPSFFVSPDRDSFYCFGCHSKGDIFNFVEQFEGLDFKGALKVLADRANISLSDFYNSDKDKSEKDLMFSVLETSLFYFKSNLEKEKIAKDYLKERGLFEKTIEDFSLGFAKDEWRGLYDFLKEKNINENIMEKTGLIKKKDGGGYYDVFRGRVIFPIFDTLGRVVAFSGRILIPNENSPKYLNSPETDLFKKSEVLYGLNFAKSHIRQMDYSILVEGQMDLVMLHQSGFLNTIASSGTALTKDHLIKIQRLSNNIIMAFDGDSAGFSAIVRGAEIALSLGMEVKVAKMPEGEDPASLSLKNKEELKNVIKNSKNIILFLVDDIVSKTKPEFISKKIVKEVLPIIAFIESSSEQSYFIKYTKDKTQIKEDALWDDLRKVSLNSTEIKNLNNNVSVQKKEGLFIEALRKIHGMLLWQENKKEKDFDFQKYKDDFYKKLTDDDKKYLENISNKEALIFETEMYYEKSKNLEGVLLDLLSVFEIDKLKKELGETLVSLNKARDIHDNDLEMDLLKKFQEISNKIEIIKRQYEKK